ncbi:MAG: NRDE family protein [Proteobacteria bacterium]|nr:NRDE family protein [Pseudomonadota bacterium]
MCIAAVAWLAHPRWRLVVAANRDEFHARPAAPLARWADDPAILAGRDLLAGGTWLGVNEATARLVLVTNRRTEAEPHADAPSRGELVRALLDGADPLTEPLAAYNPCNLLVAGPDGLVALENHPAERRAVLAPGIHGVSNGAFAPPWPKTRALCAALEHWLTGPAADPEPLFAALADRTPRPAVPGEAGAEAMFTPVFIARPDYGTRASTVVLIGADGAGHMIERRWAAGGEPAGTSEAGFTWPV